MWKFAAVHDLENRTFFGARGVVGGGGDWGGVTMSVASTRCSSSRPPWMLSLQVEEGDEVILLYSAIRRGCCGFV